MNQHATYLGQRSFTSKVIVSTHNTHTHTPTLQTDRQTGQAGQTTAPQHRREPFYKRSLKNGAI